MKPTSMRRSSHVRRSYHCVVNAEGATRVREAIVAARRRGTEQLAALERSLADIIESARLTSTDDEHDPEGAPIAYERAQVAALVGQARADLLALDAAGERADDGTVTTCAVCGGPI